MTNGPTELLYAVPAVHCEHCEQAIRTEVIRVSGVDQVDVDLVARSVRVTGVGLDEQAVRHAIDEAGFDIA